MNEYVSGLKSKFGYGDELSEGLSQLIPSLIKYYGEEYKDTILSALSNCEIHFQSLKMYQTIGKNNLMNFSLINLWQSLKKIGENC